MTSSTALARDGEKAFVWLMFEPPAEDATWTDSKVFTVNGLTDNGDITGMVLFNGEGPTRGYAFTIDGFCQEWHLLPPSNPTTIMDMNNDRTIVGWTYADTGRRWVYSGGYTTPGTGDTFEDDQVWGIDDYDNMVGLTDTEAPEAWYAEWSGWGAFNPLSGGTATAALGLNNNVASPDACGVSKDSSNNEQAVVWPSGSLNPTLLGPGTSPPHMAYRMNDNRIIIGSRWDSTASKYKFVVWTPASASTWNNAVDTGVQTPLANGRFAGAINNSDEFVIFRTLFYFDSGGMHSVDIEELVDIPIEVNQDGLRFEAINDKGWMAGYAPYSYSDPNDRRAIIIIPRDDDNNGVPDFRDIYSTPSTHPDTNGNWILDWSEDFRVGLYGVGNPTVSHADEVDNAQLIRIHMDQIELETAFLQGQQADVWSFLDHYSTDEDAAGNQREVLIMFRTRIENDPNFDRVPSEAEQEEILGWLECAARQLCRNVDYFQIGNEVSNGAGQYKFFPGQLDGCTLSDTGTPISSWVDDEDLPCAQAAYVLMMDWLRRQAEAVRRGSALGGRPIRIVGPAVTLGMLNNASTSEPYDGNEENVNPAALAVWRVFQASNAWADMSAVHLHHEDLIDQFTPALDWLIDDVGTWLSDPEWDAYPTALACTEWSPVPDPEWLASTEGGQKAPAYALAATITPYNIWDDFVMEAWWEEQQELGTDFGIPTIIDRLAADGFRFACYGNCFQISTQGNFEKWDMAALRAQLIHANHLTTGNQTAKKNLEILTPFQDSTDPYYEDHAGFEDLHPNSFTFPFNDCGCD